MPTLTYSLIENAYMLVYFLLVGLVAVEIGIDAHSRGVSGRAWGFLALLGPVVWIVWFVSRPPKRPKSGPLSS